MASGLPPSELIDLYQTARQAVWRYNLDKVEVSALQTAMRSTEKAAKDILSSPTEKLKRWEQLRRQDLIREIDSLTLGIREQVAGEISSLAGQAGAESARYHSQTMSMGGRVQGFNNVALSPEQFRSFFQTTPLGGATLSQWVNKAFDSTVRQGILEDLNAGVLQGKGYPGLVENIMGHMEGFTRKEAVTLARSFVQQANVSAQQAVMAANADIVKQWKWSSVLENSNLQTGTGTCLRCAVNDGNKYNLGEGPPIPLHPNCLTAETPVFAPDKIAAFVATYEGIVFELGLANGARFTVTPKHMLLTGEGLSPADSIRKGDKIFYNPVADGVIFGGPNNNRDDSSIANVIKSFSKTPGVVPTSVPVSPEHLHGDGEFIKGNVKIITFESLLRGDLESFRAEFLHQFNLSVSNASGLDLEGLGSLLSPLFWLRLASNRLVSGQGVSDVFSTAALRHHEAVGVGTTAPFNSVFEQKPCYDVSGNIKFSGNGIFRDTGNIKKNDVFERELVTRAINMLGLDVKGLDTSFFDSLQNSIGVNSKLFGNFTRVYAGHILPANVVSITKRKFSGHVYDLQCLSGMYHVHGVLSSNCRCVPVPQLVSYRELGIDIDELEEVARPWTERPDIPIGQGGRNILTWGKHQGEYASWFDSRGEQFQKNVVGPKRLALIQSGKVKFKDLVDPNTGRLYRLDELGKPKIAVVKVPEIRYTKSIEEAHQAMLSTAFTGAHKQAVLDYTAEHFNQVNGYLRGFRSKVTDTGQTTIAGLDSFFERAPRVEAQVFRGVTLSEDKFKQWATMRKGDTYIDKGFMSTSLDKSVMMDFLGSERYQVEMYVKGKSGVLIDMLSDNKREREILFNRGQAFKVEKIKVKKGKFTGKIVMEIKEI